MDVLKQYDTIHSLYISMDRDKKAICPRCNKKNLSITFRDDSSYIYGCFTNACDFKGISSKNTATYSKNEYPKSKTEAIDEYRKLSKKEHRLTDEIIKEFNIGFEVFCKNNYSSLCIRGDDDFISGRYESENFKPVKRLSKTFKDGAYKFSWYSVANDFDNKSICKWVNVERAFKGLKERDTLYIFGGEWDVMTFWAKTGIHAISFTNGEGGKQNYYLPQIAKLIEIAKKIVIIYDNDNTGREGSEILRIKIQSIVPKHTKVLNVDIRKLIDTPTDDNGEDIDDYFIKHGGTLEAIDTLVETLELSRDEDNYIFANYIEICNNMIKKYSNHNLRKNIFNPYKMVGNEKVLIDFTSVDIPIEFYHFYFKIFTLPESLRQELLKQVISSSDVSEVPVNSKGEPNYKVKFAKQKIFFDIIESTVHDLNKKYVIHLLHEAIKEHHIVRRGYTGILTSDYSIYFFNGVHYEVLNKQFKSKIVRDIVMSNFTEPSPSKMIGYYNLYEREFTSIIDSYTKIVIFEDEKYKRSFKTFKNGTLIINNPKFNKEKGLFWIGDFQEGKFFPEYYDLSYIDLNYKHEKHGHSLNSKGVTLFGSTMNSWFRHGKILENGTNEIEREFVKSLYYLAMLPKDQQNFLFFYGNQVQGQNAKGEASKLFEFMAGVDKTSRLSLDALDSEFMLAELIDKNLNICDEVDKSRHIEKNGLFKSLTANESMTFNKKHKTPIKASLDNLWLILSNEVLPTNDSSKGMYRRIKPITFAPVTAEQRILNFFKTQLLPLMDEILPFIIFAGMKWWNEDGGFAYTDDNESVINDLKSNNSINNYWDDVLVELLVEGETLNSLPKEEKLRRLVSNEYELNEKDIFKDYNKLGFFMNHHARHQDYQYRSPKGNSANVKTFKNDTINFLTREFGNLLDIKTTDRVLRLRRIFYKNRDTGQNAKPNEPVSIKCLDTNVKCSII